MKRFKNQYGCPVELSLEFVGGKWSTVILAWLKEAPHRYGELGRRMPGVADKVLSEKLQNLERLGLVSKVPIEDAPGSHLYRLTPRGDSLRPVLNALHSWGEAMAQELEISVKATPLM